jgi:hypothetical protein
LVSGRLDSQVVEFPIVDPIPADRQDEGELKEEEGSEL